MSAFNANKYLHFCQLYPQCTKYVLISGRGGDTGPLIRYEFTIITGTVRHAGTDAHVYLMMFCKLGKTRELQLDDGKDHFEKGQTDVFKVIGISN